MLFVVIFVDDDHDFAAAIQNDIAADVFVSVVIVVVVVVVVVVAVVSIVVIVVVVVAWDENVPGDAKLLTEAAGIFCLRKMYRPPNDPQIVPKMIPGPKMVPLKKLGMSFFS